MLKAEKRRPSSLITATQVAQSRSLSLSAMPYSSLSLVRPSNAEFFNTSKRSTGLIFKIFSENILAAARGCLGSGYAHDYLDQWNMQIEEALLSGVSSPENCMSASGTKRCRCPVSNEIVIQPSIPNGPSCSITGAFVLENSPDFSDWKPQSQEFYNWSKDKGLAVIRFSTNFLDLEKTITD